MTATTTSDRRQTILDATLDLAAERGLLGTTISQIAKRAEASPGIIYHYFENKDELVHILFDTIEQAVVTAIVDGVDLDAPWRERITHIWLNAFHYFAGHPRQTVFWEQYKNSAYHKYDGTLTTDDMTARLVATLEADAAAGRIKPLPFPVLYTMTVGVAVGLAKLQIRGVVQLDEAQLADLADGVCDSLVA